MGHTKVVGIARAFPTIPNMRAFPTVLFRGHIPHPLPR